MSAAATLAGAAPDIVTDWHAINWQKVRRNVRRLQARIVKAIQEGRWNKVQALVYLLTHSYSGRAVRVHGDKLTLVPARSSTQANDCVGFCNGVPSTCSQEWRMGRPIVGKLLPTSFYRTSRFLRTLHRQRKIGSVVRGLTLRR
jgi:N-terminal domain of reverse transcriptase